VVSDRPRRSLGADRLRGEGDVRVNVLHTSPGDPARRQQTDVSVADLVLDRMSEPDPLAALTARAEELAGADELSGAVLVARHGEVLPPGALPTVRPVRRTYRLR
jgi:hypothetical protein